MCCLARMLRVGLLGLFTGTAFSVSTAASALVGDPMALRWKPQCFNEFAGEPGAIVGEGEPGLFCGAFGGGSVSDSAPHQDSTGGAEFAVTLTGMTHIELFPLEAQEELDFVLGAIQFKYQGMLGDTIDIDGYLSDEHRKEIPDTTFFGTVSTDSVPGFEAPCEAVPMTSTEFSCIALLLIGNIETGEPLTGGVTFHDIHFNMVASPDASPTFTPESLFFFTPSSFQGEDGENQRPVGKVGNWSSIPEPATVLLLGLGLAGLGFTRRPPN